MEEVILAVDFDDTIHDVKSREFNRKMGKPVPYAKETIEWVYERGGEVIVHSIWADRLPGRVAIADWMNYFKIPFREVTATKPKDADHYIDNKNLPVPFTSWLEIRRILEQLYDE